MQPTDNRMDQGHPFGFILEDKIFLKSFLHFPEREIGIVKDSPEDTISYFENRFILFEKKVEELFEAIEKAENKGSFLQKLLHLKDICGSYDALGDFAAMYKKLEDMELSLHDLISKNRVKNLAQKKALIQELEVLKESNDWINAAESIKEIRNKWIRIGSVEKVVEEEIETMYKEFVDIFFKRRQEFFDERNLINGIKLKKYEDLSNQADAIKNSPDIKKTIDEFKRIKEDWKKVGPVPKKDLQPIWLKYKAANDSFFRKLKENKLKRESSSPSVGIQGNKLEKFERLVAEAERIVGDMPYQGDEQIKKLQEEWKRMGNPRTEEFRSLEFKFRANCVKALDTYFVNRLSYKRNPNYRRLAPKEQLKLQIGVLKELIVRDREQIENFENNFSKLEVNSQTNSFDKVFGSKLHNQKRNLESKKKLLKEFEEKLSTMI